MTNHLFGECPTCGWDPRCASQRDDRELSDEDAHDHVVEHVQLTDDKFHNRIESEL